MPLSTPEASPALRIPGAPATSRRALVVGLGVAGLACAIRLAQIGWDVVVVERAPVRRGGGYMVGLFGIGQVTAKRMGLLGTLDNRFDGSMRGYEVDRQGRHPGMNFARADGQRRDPLRHLAGRYHP